MNQNKLLSYVPSFIKQLFNPESDRSISFVYGDKLNINDEGIRMTFDTSSVGAKRWFYPRYSGGNLHEPVVSKKLIDLLDSESVFFDIGSHMGYYTVLASQCCTEIHSFEIDPQLVGVIDSHFDYNDMNDGTVNILCSAVTEESGHYTSYTPHQSENPSTNAINPAESVEGGRIRVPTISVDDYCAITGTSPDVLKIDVEGFEVDVLDGMTEAASTVDAILLEVHPELLPRYGHDLKTLFTTLEEYGFSISQFMEHRAKKDPESVLKSVDGSQEISENCMLLCTK